MTYTRYAADIDATCNIDPILRIDHAHPVSAWLRQSGIVLEGDETEYAVRVNSKVGVITYQVRRALTKPNLMLSTAILDGNTHPLWTDLTLEGVPEIWGVAVIVWYRDSSHNSYILLGRKKPIIRSLPSTYGGLLCVPGGALELQDCYSEAPFKVALIRAGLRELREETGLHFARHSYLGLELFVDTMRNKQQAFIIVNVPTIMKEWKLEGIDDELSRIGFYRIEDLQRSDISMETEKALELLNGG